MRTAKISRDTKETKIALELNLDGSGEGEISTGIGFFDHMLELLKKHALVDLTVKADGDLKVDYHHTVEDVGLVLGKALNEALRNSDNETLKAHWDAFATVYYGTDSKEVLEAEIRKLHPFIATKMAFFISKITEGKHPFSGLLLQMFDKYLPE